MNTTASHAVAKRLRRRIVEGRWAPGTRLPAREALARMERTCLATLQAAMRQLADEGFLCVGPRSQGTFVAAQPPHLCHYKVIFPKARATTNQFWLALHAAVAQRTSPTRQFSCFYGLDGHADIDAYQEVVEEVRTHRVAGLIFASSADELHGTPLFEQPGLPRVAVANEDELPGIPKVSVNLPSFFQRAVGNWCARDGGASRCSLLTTRAACAPCTRRRWRRMA